VTTKLKADKADFTPVNICVEFITLELDGKNRETVEWGRS
jgi:hypothetical protein